jgi:4'-phosphopantetheinyl transferase
MNIGKHEIHIWFAHDREITSPKLILDYQSMLNDAERHQYQRFYFEKHRHQYLVTRALVRTTLSHYYNIINPGQWLFIKNHYGKPAIGNNINLPLQFNLSHSEGMIVMAVTLMNAVGVDIEWTLRNGQSVEIAEKFFSPEEVAQLYKLPEQHQRERFFELWTLKEAYIKAFGKGLSIPLDQFSFSFLKDQIGISFGPNWQDQPENYAFWQLQPNSSHKAALALKSDITVSKEYSLHFKKTVPMQHISEINLPYFPGPRLASLT